MVTVDSENRQRNIDYVKTWGTIAEVLDRMNIYPSSPEEKPLFCDRLWKNGTGGRSGPDDLKANIPGSKPERSAASYERGYWRHIPARTRDGTLSGLSRHLTRPLSEREEIRGPGSSAEWAFVR